MQILFARDSLWQIKGNTVIEVPHDVCGIMQVLMFDKYLNNRSIRNEARGMRQYLYKHSYNSPGNVRNGVLMGDGYPNP